MRKANKLLMDKSTVRIYKHFEELRDCLASGWSIPTVRSYLAERYGPEDVPSLAAMTKWREKHLETAARVIPHELIMRKLKGVQFKVDVIGHLSRLVGLLEDRVGRGIEQEETFGGIPLAVNDGVVQVYLQAIMNYVQVAQDLGILKSRPAVPLIDARSINVAPETARTLLEVIKEIKIWEIRDGELGRIEAGDTRNDQKADA